MKHIVQRGRRGASLVLALLIFLLCALAGASALIMAAANAGRYSHMEDDQQPYYSVTSAAMLMIDLLDGATYTSAAINYVYERTWKVTGSADASDHPQDESYSINILTEGGAFNKDACVGKFDGKDMGSGSGLCTELRKYCDKLVPFLGVQDEWYKTVSESLSREGFRPQAKDYLDYTLRITPEDAENVFGTVVCRVIMQEDYNLIFSFVYQGAADGSSGSGSGSGDTGSKGSLYAANVYWEAEVTQTTESKQSEVVYTQKGSLGSMTTTNTKTIKVTWDRANATISRGEAVGKE